MKSSNKTSEKDINNKTNLLPIAGIGASAGGLAALKTFFDRVPTDSGLAYVVVVHLSPEHKSILAELLQPHINMPVQQVTESTHLKANHVYVIPPNANLNTIDTHLRLSELEQKRGARAPIDHFFRTLAKTHGRSSIGIILTGTGSDGTLGIKEIKAAGGLTIVQDPAEAEYDGMPQSAIITGLIDVVLPIKEMPGYLVKFINTKPKLNFIKSEKEISEKDMQLLHKIFSQIKARTRRDFRNYKTSTLIRRLQRRMQMYQMEEVEDYLDLLRNNPEEVRMLSDDFLINVTNFFRDKEAFQFLEKKILPKIADGKKPDEQLRVWSVGCASGEEAYSLAILLDELNRQKEMPIQIQIFASDLHEPALKKAREGFFPGDIKSEMSKERLQQYFAREDGGYRIKKELRDQVVFTPHNLLGDPPFSRVDLVVCRNLLIYLKKNIQRDVFELFHYSLNPGGYLMLGTSESLESTDLFSTESKEYSVYRRKNVNGLEPRLPVFPATQNHFKSHKVRDKEYESVSFGELHHKMVEHYGPPSLLISPDYQVLHVSETAGRYMKIAGGELSRDAFKLIHPELILELRSTVYSAKEQEEMVRSKPVNVHIEGEPRLVIISARYIKEQDANNILLVLFEEYEQNYALKKDRILATSNEADIDHVKELEEELQDNRQRLQAVIEEYETSREEMKASNEELQSANEELRSTLEELETSKEELQSMNEELTTLNQENRHKVEELSRLSDDLQNLMASTDIATLFLTRDLRILRYTPRLGELFNVKPADKGRKISDLTNKLTYNNLTQDATKVLKDLQPVEHEILDEDGNVYFTRLLPYRSAEDKIEGVVITFVDITPLRKAELARQKSEEKYKALFESIDAGFCILDMIFDENGKAVDYRFLEMNPAFQNQSGLKDATGKRVKELIPENEVRWYEIFGRVAETGKSERFENEVKFLGRRWYEINAFKVGKKEETKVAVLFTDINDYKKQAKELRQAKTEAEESARIKEDFLAHMSHEIRTPLNALLGISHLLMEKSPRVAQKENLITLKLAAENLSRLVNDVLDFSKIQAGKMKMEPVQINIREFISRVIEIHKNTTEIKGLALNYHIDESIPAFIQTDEHKLSHALHNLLSNAVKFTHKGNVELKVGLQQQEKENLWLEFSVIDSGIGIPEDKLEDIFDVFCQADNSTVRSYGGTGLGLAITKLYLEMMDSSIHVESKPGEGSRFFFVLPVKSVDKADFKASVSEESAKPEDLKDIKILLVEDDEYNREILQQIFGMWKVSFDTAENGKLALEKATKNKYDIILMDVRMPVMDGYEATTKIRKLEKYTNTPIVALTADVSKKVKDEMQTNKFTDILVKPVKPQILLNKIKELIES